MSTAPSQDRGEGHHTDNWMWPGRREGSLQQEGVRALTWVFLAPPSPAHWPHWDKSADWGQGDSHGAGAGSLLRL